jgi:hypothetical protein
MPEIDLILDNARLRDELEPFMDESVFCVDMDKMTVHGENEYLSSLLAWEKAPILPISQWYQPELALPAPQSLTDSELHQLLHQVIGRLFEKQIVLLHTDHLSDRQLYCLIARDILPAEEKRVMIPENFIRWQCLDIVEDEESWLRFYASDEERNQWHWETGLRLPPKESLPFPRNLPTAGV